ncbi:uncharacterized protein LOC6598056 [Drosophila persimilis]|uniref:uncharacterized protein LOC6598056 n=1 Tax=Drosophila persimilis TaxID=7234 RepID=UPI000F090DA9|nr:uncharacterized protein LOC6598056 [Drosophila persimilis]
MRIFSILCLCLLAVWQSEATFDLVGKGLYYIGNEDGTLRNCDWFLSRRDCWKHNSQLVSVETIEELKALEDYALSKGFADGSTFATSGHSFDSEMPYSWEGVKQPLTFTRWMPGTEKPLSKSYLSLVLSNSTLYMRRSFGYDNYYICEYQPALLRLWLSMSTTNWMVLAGSVLISIRCMIFLCSRKTRAKAKVSNKEKLISTADSV